MLAKASVQPNTVEVANRLFPDNGFSPRPEFLDTAAAHYGATIQPVDTADGSAAADVINNRVSGRTRGHICDVQRFRAATPDLVVVADRPFLWAIIHQQTQAVLFVGRLVDPTA